MATINHLSNSSIGLSGSVGSNSKNSSITDSYSPPQSPSSVNEQKTDTVSISGKAMMLSRLFKSDGSVEPKYESKITFENMNGLVFSFLTKGDREMLATAYEYANENGIDLSKVDSLAFDLAIHRRVGPNGHIDSAGNMYDLNGNPRIPQFTEQDEAVAQRLLTSVAIKDTQINHGFLKNLLTPTIHPVHASDFEFLEELVYFFSASGSDGATDPNAKPVIRHKPEDFPPLDMSRKSSNESNSTMVSRLLGIEVGKGMNILDVLSDKDKSTLSQLYAIAQERNEDLTQIDNLALMLASYKMLDQLFKQSMNS